MLVLSRKEGEEVVITAVDPIPAGEEIRIVLVDMRVQSRVSRIGIEAGCKFLILRSELRPRK